MRHEEANLETSEGLPPPDSGVRREEIPSGDIPGTAGKNAGGKKKRNCIKAREFYSWTNMLTRCYNPKFRYFSDYGGRGILVCDRWRKSYPAFLADMGRRPSPAHSLERRDNSRGYEPDNCLWVTIKEQANNRRSSRLITAFGATKTLAQWSEEKGIQPATIAYRLDRKWPVELALTSPPSQCKTRNRTITNQIES